MFMMCHVKPFTLPGSLELPWTGHRVKQHGLIVSSGYIGQDFAYCFVCCKAVKAICGREFPGGGMLPENCEPVQHMLSKPAIKSLLCCDQISASMLQGAHPPTCNQPVPAARTISSNSQCQHHQKEASWIRFAFMYSAAEQESKTL